MSEQAAQHQCAMKKLQYMVIAHGQAISVANIFATEVEEYADLWMLCLCREIVCAVWKKHATLTLCPSYYAEAAAEAHYPVISIGNSWAVWPARRAGCP